MSKQRMKQKGPTMSSPQHSAQCTLQASVMLTCAFNPLSPPQKGMQRRGRNESMDEGDWPSLKPDTCCNAFEIVCAYLHPGRPLRPTVRSLNTEYTYVLMTPHTRARPNICNTFAATRLLWLLHSREFAARLTNCKRR